ncbi:MAG: hypothetical protein H7325_10475 [Pedobacter sp.]|nr:hypothetical protein [Pedobacter sp.]
MNDAAAAGYAVGFGLGSIVYLLFLVAIIVGMWKTFEKAGKPGWAAIIPIYNLIVLLEIIGKPMIWLLWLLIPCVNFIFGIWAINLLSKSFGKSVGFTLGLIFLSFIFFPILGFGDAKYLGPSAADFKGGGNNQFGAGNINNPFNNPNNPYDPTDPTNPPVV